MNSLLKSNEILAWAAFSVAVVGGFSDLYRRKIPNKMTFPVMAAGLAVNLVWQGGDGLINSVSGLLMGFSAFLLFAIGALKAGDVKLYMAVGAVSGWHFCMNTIVWSILLGGLSAFVLTLFRKNGKEVFRNLWIYGKNILYSRKFYMYEPASEESYFSFGCCIAAGTFAAIIRPLL